MDKKVLGFAIMLISLILLIGFTVTGWEYIFHGLGFTWQMLFMLTAVAGFVLVVLSAKKKK